MAHDPYGEMLNRASGDTPQGMRDKTDLEVAATKHVDICREIDHCQSEIDAVAARWHELNEHMDHLLKQRAEFRDAIKAHVDNSVGDPRSPNKEPFSADDGPVRISGRQNRDADRIGTERGDGRY